MIKLASLHVYSLWHPEVEQGAWVRADSLAEASTELFGETQIPIVVTQQPGWALLPEWRPHADSEERPVPHWEYLHPVRGPAELRGLPQCIRVLAEHRGPRRHGQVKLGPQISRPAPLPLRSIPPASVPGPVQVFHSGYRLPYDIGARQMWGYEGNFNSIEIGRTALLELEETKGYPTIGDVVRIRAKGNGSDQIVTGRVVRKSLILDIVAIETRKMS